MLKAKVNVCRRRPLMTYYPSNREELRVQIRQCIDQGDQYPVNADTLAHFQRLTTTSRPSEACRSIGSQLKASPYIFLVPHGAFCDSGSLLAKACQVLEGASSRMGARNTRPKTFCFIGTNHFSSDMPMVSLSSQIWQTPLGEVPRDDGLFRFLTQSGIQVNDEAHVQEHSIENMIPFAQFFFGSSSSDIQMVGINCCPPSPTTNYESNEDGLKAIQQEGHSLATILKEYCNRINPTRDLIIMATTDYTHAGPEYGELPPGYGELPPPGLYHQSIPEYIRQRDQALLREISQLDMPSLYSVGMNTSMCGLGSALVAMEIAKACGKQNGWLLQYAVGSDMCDRGLEDQTGFASFVFD